MPTFVNESCMSFFTAMALSNFWHSYTAQAIFCAVFGITSGAYVGLTSVVLVDLLGLDNLTSAFGLLLLFQGIASVMGPPFIGEYYASCDWLKNSVSSCDWLNKTESKFSPISRANPFRLLNTTKRTFRNHETFNKRTSFYVQIQQK